MGNPIFYNAIMPVLYTMSVITFILFAYDKHCASFGKFRIPEWVLVLFSACGGAFGALCSMIFFNHKTAKPLFYIAVPLLLLAQVLICVFILWFL